MLFLHHPAGGLAPEFGCKITNFFPYGKKYFSQLRKNLMGVYTPMKNLQLTATGTFTGPMLVYHHVHHDHEAKHEHGSGHVHMETTPSFFDLTLKASYSIPLGEQTQLELNIGVQNVFDSYQRDHNSGPERDASYIYGPSLPRTLIFGAKLSI